MSHAVSSEPSKRRPFGTCKVFFGFLSLLILLVVPSIAQAAPSEFGLRGARLATTEAGRHGDFTTEVLFTKQTSGPGVNADMLKVELPEGLLTNRQNVPACPLANFQNPFDGCPQDSQVGLVSIEMEGYNEIYNEPLYNLATAKGQFIRLGFIAICCATYLQISLRSDSDYGAVVTASNIPAEGPLKIVRTKIWGVPADPIHDTERLTPLEALFCGASGGVPCFVGGSRSTDAVPVPFATNPVNCGPTPFFYETSTYQLPGQTFRTSASAQDITDCDKVPFEPSLALSTTNRKAGAPTGLEATLTVPQNEGVDTINPSPVRAVRVQFPEGMTINSAAANGMEGCSVSEAAFGVLGPGHCPNKSKLGTATIVSPNLERSIEGGVYLRTPEPGHPTRFWLISNELGLDLKIAGEVELDPNTGRLTAVISRAPQLPSSEVTLRLNGGPRAAIRNPLACGTYRADYQLTPWSGTPPVSGSAPITVDKDCNTGGFNPKLSAGTTDPTAGRFSPFVFDLTRQDGEENIAGLDVKLPQGLTGKLADIGVCPEAGAATGACPTGSQIGSVTTAVGAGPLPLWVPQAGKDPTAVYLAGPYKGAPYSIVAKVPAQAGPFDLGVVAVRSGIYIDPATAEVTVKSDALPQFIEGIALDYRHIRLAMGRDGFILNPTSCDPMTIAATLRSATGATASPSNRFQAVECQALGFKPTLTLQLRGKTKRTAHPALHAVLTPKPGQANLDAVSAALPHSEFLDQAHIGTVCTRVQFAADACPRASIYGRAKATTPLLDQPLAGPVYLRSSNHDLPDLVIALQGQNGIEIETAARIDSVRGGIRTSFEGVPDVPISKVTLDMFGGRRGLLVNSRNICAGKPNRATVSLDAHNGKVNDLRPVLRASCR